MTPEERIQDAKDYGYRPALTRGDIVKKHKRGVMPDTLYVVMRVLVQGCFSSGANKNPYKAMTSNGNDLVEIMAYKRKDKPRRLVWRKALWFTGKRLFE